MKRLHELQQNIQQRRESSQQTREFKHYQPAAGGDKSAVYQRIRAQEYANRVDTRETKDYSSDLYDDLSYRLPQVDNQDAILRNNRNVGSNLNNLPTIGASQLGIVGNQANAANNYTPVLKYNKATPSYYGSAQKYGPQASSIESLNPNFLYRSRTKENQVLGSKNHLNSNRYGGAASIIAEGRLDQQKMAMERYRRIDVAE